MPFLKWAQSDAEIIALGIDWASASVSVEGLIRVPVTNSKHLRDIMANRKVLWGTYALVSYMGDTIEKTAKQPAPTYHAPLTVGPLPMDTTFDTIVSIFANRGTNPVWGPITVVQRLQPPTVFAAQVWNPAKRNQILRNSTVSKPLCKIRPSDPAPGMTDHTAIVIYNKGTPTDVINLAALIKQELPRNLEHPSCIAQYFDHETEMELQKWLLGFEHPYPAQQHLQEKAWIERLGRDMGLNLNVGPCKGKQPNKPTKDAQKDNKGSRGRGSRGRGRDRK